MGFEEALFLANKIKSNLGGSLSTEKVLYLLFITLQRKHEATRKPRHRDSVGERPILQNQILEEGG